MKRLLLILALSVSLMGCGTVSKWLSNVPTADEIREQVHRIEIEADKALIELEKLRAVELISESDYIEATARLDEIRAGLSLIKILLDVGRTNDAHKELSNIPTLKPPSH